MSFVMGVVCMLLGALASVTKGARAPFLNKYDIAAVVLLFSGSGMVATACLIKVSEVLP